jgi:hypothetical protein
MEGDRASVVGEGVDLDDEARLAPEEVDLPATELDVGLRRRDVVAMEESEGGGLEVTAGAIALDAIESRAFVLGLTDGAADEVRREEG